MKLVIKITIILLLVAPQPVLSGMKPDGTLNRAEWMARGTFGIMTHYLIKPRGATPAEKTADLNRIVNSFDLKGYIRQIKETGADWVIFTLGQTTGYLCSPNAYLDKRTPGMTPHRDLAKEISEKLHQMGIRMILYIPSAENADPAIKMALDENKAGYDERYFAFLREYAVRLGKLCDGWWFDACGPHPDAYWIKWIAALRAGNDNAVVAFSAAEFCGGGPINPICRFEDYHAGEIHLLENGRIRRDFLWPPGNVIVVGGKLRLRGQEARTYMPDGPFIDNVQWHGLLPLDLSFNPAIPDKYCHYTDRELFKFVGDIKAVGGAITINAPMDVATGRLQADSHAQLVRLGKWLHTGEKLKKPL